jgi:GTP-binding protein
MQKIHHIYHNAKFILSCPNIKDAPADEGIEVIFAGRSNAGKSSCINTLTGQKKLAKVSKTPGRTQHLVFFDISQDEYENNKLVDLPGYGFAKVPTAVKNRWNDDMSEYFQKRKALKGAVLLMDIRHPLKEFDELMLEWCLNSNINTHILLTKSDKLKKNQANKSLFEVQKRIEGTGMSVSLFSSLKKSGIETLHKRLGEMYGFED